MCLLASDTNCLLVQKYRRALDIITQESGLLESSILDIRGNHDAFDMGQRYCQVPLLSCRPADTGAHSLSAGPNEVSSTIRALRFFWVRFLTYFAWMQSIDSSRDEAHFSNSEHDAVELC
jgi:hypothetical protein